MELSFKGSSYLKQRLILATLSGKTIKITDIRTNDGGIREFEINLIRLIDKLTDGSKIKLLTTELEYCPGILIGGKIEHQCCLEKSIGYYLDMMIAFGPFCKDPIEAIMKGITNSSESPSVDHFKASAFNILRRFLVDEDAYELKVLKRGMKPLGGGEILFKIKPVTKLKTLQLEEDSGMVKRIRGVIYACKVSPTFANRTVEVAKGIMLNFLPDVYIHTDHQNKKKSSGLSPGFGVNLSAETTENVIYAAEVVSTMQGTLPEDIGKECANKLLDEIYRGGCCDSTFQWILLLYMALGPKNVSKALSGPLTQYSIKFLQHLREFLGITFKLDTFNEEKEYEHDVDIASSPKVLLACVGIGYSNLSKRIL